MRFNARGQLIDFGLGERALTDLIRLGTPFMTTGCYGPDGEVACNRPFGNCQPDVRQWNYPYRPDQEETALIREHIFRSS
jgi:biotin synthase